MSFLEIAQEPTNKKLEQMNRVRLAPQPFILGEWNHSDPPRRSIWFFNQEVQGTKQALKQQCKSHSYSQSICMVSQVD